jgi:hypothetical protein
LNAQVPPWQTEENQLTECRNLWWDRGALRKRKGLYTGPGRQFTCAGRVQYMPGEVQLLFGASEERWGRLGISIGGEAGTYRVEVIFTDQYSRSVVCGPPILLAVQQKPDGMVVCYTAEGGRKMLLLILNTGQLFRLSPDDLTLWKEVDEELYVPLVMKNGGGVASFDKASAQGDEYESYNMLGPRFRVQFTTDDQSCLYLLPCKSLDHAPVTIWLHLPDGTANFFRIAADTDHTRNIDGTYAFVNRAGGYIYFNTSGTAGEFTPLTGVSGIRNNLEVTAEKTWAGNRETITGMRFYSWYGGDRSSSRGGVRLFLSGNPSCPNLVHWSDSGEPLYFPQENSSFVGEDSQAVTAFGRQGKSLVIFKEREIYAVTYAARTAAAEPASMAYFPITQLHTGVGCDSPDTLALWRDRLVWMDRGKLYRLKTASSAAGGSVSELARNLGERLADIREEKRRQGSAAVYRDRYWLLAGDCLFLLDADREEDSPACYIWTVGLAGVTWESLLTSDGQLTLMGSVQRGESGPVRFHYTLSGDRDILPAYSAGSWSFSGEEVACAMETGQLDFGEPDQGKQIRRILLHSPGDASWKAEIKLTTERESHELTGNTGERKNSLYTLATGRNTLCLPVGMAAARRLTIRMESREDFAVEGLSVEYRPTGRKE